MTPSIQQSRVYRHTLTMGEETDHLSDQELGEIQGVLLPHHVGFRRGKEMPKRASAPEWGRLLLTELQPPKAIII